SPRSGNDRAVPTSTEPSPARRADLADIPRRMGRRANIASPCLAKDPPVIKPAIKLADRATRLMKFGGSDGYHLANELRLLLIIERSSRETRDGRTDDGLAAGHSQHPSQGSAVFRRTGNCQPPRRRNALALELWCAGASGSSSDECSARAGREAR